MIAAMVNAWIPNGMRMIRWQPWRIKKPRQMTSALHECQENRSGQGVFGQSQVAIFKPNAGPVVMDLSPSVVAVARSEVGEILFGEGHGLELRRPIATEVGRRDFVAAASGEESYGEEARSEQSGTDHSNSFREGCSTAQLSRARPWMSNPKSGIGHDFRSFGVWSEAKWPVWRPAMG